MNKIKHQNEHFGEIAEEYYEARIGKNYCLYRDLLLGYALRGMNKSNKVLYVLEPMCGCGEGKETVERYISSNIVYEGFDFNETLIKRAKECNPEINIFKQDVTTFKAEKKYDLIILIGGLHHVPDYAQQVLENFCDALKPNGLFINFEPTYNCSAVWLVRKLIYRINHLFDENTERAFSFKELNAMYKKAGFKVKRQLYPGLLGYALWFNPDAFPLLNIGTEKTIRGLFKKEKKLYSNWFGKKFSFCTLSILGK